MQLIMETRMNNLTTRNDLEAFHSIEDSQVERDEVMMLLDRRGDLQNSIKAVEQGQKLIESQFESEYPDLIKVLADLQKEIGELNEDEYRAVSEQVYGEDEPPERDESETFKQYHARLASYFHPDSQSSVIHLFTKEEIGDMNRDLRIAKRERDRSRLDKIQSIVLERMIQAQPSEEELKEQIQKDMDRLQKSSMYVQTLRREVSDLETHYLSLVNLPVVEAAVLPYVNGVVDLSRAVLYVKGVTERAIIMTQQALSNIRRMAESKSQTSL